MKKVIGFLKSPEWPEGIEVGKIYSRQHDDTDGASDGNLMLQFSRDGDAWISIDGKKTLRFRNWGGGGKSMNTYAALLILAKAIQLDDSQG